MSRQPSLRVPLTDDEYAFLRGFAPTVLQRSFGLNSRAQSQMHKDKVVTMFVKRSLHKAMAFGEDAPFAMKLEYMYRRRKSKNLKALINLFELLQDSRIKGLLASNTGKIFPISPFREIDTVTTALMQMQQLFLVIEKMHPDLFALIKHTVMLRKKAANRNDKNKENLYEKIIEISAEDVQ